MAWEWAVLRATGPWPGREWRPRPRKPSASSGPPSLPSLTPSLPRAVTQSPLLRNRLAQPLHPASPLRSLGSSFLERTENLLLSELYNKSWKEAPLPFTNWSREASPRFLCPSSTCGRLWFTPTGLVSALHWVPAQTLPGYVLWANSSSQSSSKVCPRRRGEGIPPSQNDTKGSQPMVGCEPPAS